jgi:hypothetical protein
MVNLDKLVEIFYDRMTKAIEAGSMYPDDEKLALLAVCDYGWEHGNDHGRYIEE